MLEYTVDTRIVPTPEQVKKLFQDLRRVAGPRYSANVDKIHCKIIDCDRVIDLLQKYLRVYANEASLLEWYETVMSLEPQLRGRGQRILLNKFLLTLRCLVKRSCNTPERLISVVATFMQPLIMIQ